MRLMGGVKVVVILTTLVYIYVVRLYLRFLSERRWTSFAAVMVILVLMSLMGSRTYPFIIIIMGVVLFNIVGVLSNKKIFILGAIAVFFLIGLRYRTIQKLPPETYKWYVENQIIIPGSQVKSVYNLTTRTFRNIYKRNHEIFNGVPASFPFLHGESLFFQFYALALPGKQQNPHIRLNHELFKGSDTEGAYPPTILSQFYLDFGWFGQILGPFLLGFIFQLMYYKLMVQRNFYYLFLFLFTNYAMYISLYGAFPLFNVFFVAIIGLMFTVSFKFNSALESS
jgi:oligosaccharide repeat unit polymerase